MRITCITAVTHFWVAVALCGQSVSFGPRPQLQPPQNIVLTFEADQEPEKVRVAAQKAAAGLGLSFESRREIDMLITSELPPKRLDEYCAYPVVDRRNGEPLDTYQSLQARMVARPGRKERVRGSVTMSLGILASSTGQRFWYRLESRCRVDVGKYSGGSAVGLLEAFATSRTILEREFLDQLFAELDLGEDVRQSVQLKLPTRPSERQFQEECPLRFEVHLNSPLVERKKWAIPGHPRIHCRGVAISEIRMRARAGLWSPVEHSVLPGSGVVLRVGTRIVVPPGEDQWLTVVASLFDGDRVIATGEEAIEGEEGDINWEGGIPLSLSAEDADLSPLLRIEVRGAEDEHESVQ